MERIVSNCNEIIKWTILFCVLGIALIVGAALQYNLCDVQKGTTEELLLDTGGDKFNSRKRKIIILNTKKLSTYFFATHRTDWGEAYTRGRKEYLISKRFRGVENNDESRRNLNGGGHHNVPHKTGEDTVVRKRRSRAKHRHLDFVTTADMHVRDVASSKIEMLESDSLDHHKTKRETEYEWDEYDQEEIEKEQDLWEKIADRWQGVAVRVIIGVCFVITFCMCCCRCCIVGCTQYRRSRSLGQEPGWWDTLTCKDPLFIKMRAWANQFGLKLDYKMYLELKNQAERIYQEREMGF